MTCEAEELLAGAAAWWDVSSMREGDRWLRNRGMAGPCLDMRLGSSTIPNSNDPMYLAPEDHGYVYFPGTTSDYLWTADSAEQRVGTDFEIVMQIRFANWQSTGTRALLNRWISTNQHSFLLLIGSGVPILYTSADGSTDKTYQATAAVTFAANQIGWIKVTHDADNGSGNSVVKFYSSPDGVNWTQLGNTRTGTVTNSIYSTAVPTRIGTSVYSFDGWFYRAQLNNEQGACVLDINADALASGAQSTFSAITGQPVTINRPTSGRKAVAMPSRNLQRQPHLGANLLTANLATGGEKAGAEGWYFNTTSYASVAVVAGYAGGSAFQIGRASSQVGLMFGTDRSSTTFQPAAGILPVVAGDTYTARAEALFVAGDVAGIGLAITFFAADGLTVTDTMTFGSFVSVGATPSVISVTRTAPAGSAYAACTIRTQYTGTNRLFNVDSFSFHQGTSTDWFPASDPVSPGAPLLLFGTDDYCEVQGSEQHGWLNFDKGQPFSIVVVGRRWNTSTTTYIAKKADFSGTQGWAVYSYLTNSYVDLKVADGTDGVDASFASSPLGALWVFAGRLRGADQRLFAMLNKVAGASTSARDLKSSAVMPTALQPARVAIGRTGSGDYSDWECYAAAIFRRALSDREIAVITDYYSARAA